MIIEHKERNSLSSTLVVSEQEFTSYEPVNGELQKSNAVQRNPVDDPVHRKNAIPNCLDEPE
jgi:hypothetical protein